MKIVTYCAQAKFLRLIKKCEASSIKLTWCTSGGFNIEPQYTSVVANDMIIISHIPKIIADKYTISKLAENSVNFDYNSGDFEISRK